MYKYKIIYKKLEALKLYCRYAQNVAEEDTMQLLILQGFIIELEKIQTITLSRTRFEQVKDDICE